MQLRDKKKNIFFQVSAGNIKLKESHQKLLQENWGRDNLNFRTPTKTKVRYLF